MDMKKLFEEYVESADYKITVFFKELEVQIKKWFETKYVTGGGVKLKGLVERRKSESKLYFL